MMNMRDPEQKDCSSFVCTCCPICKCSGSSSLLFIMFVECLNKMVMKHDEHERSRTERLLFIICLHLLSHLGTIGQIMTGSGISKLLDRIFTKGYSMQVSGLYQDGGDPHLEEINHFGDLKKTLKTKIKE